jgi:hypothetical protein
VDRCDAANFEPNLVAFGARGFPKKVILSRIYSYHTVLVHTVTLSGSTRLLERGWCRWGDRGL